MNKPRSRRGFVKLMGRRPTLPHSRPCSTIGAEKLNCRVRDGNGCDLLAIVTQTWDPEVRRCRDRKESNIRRDTLRADE